MNETYLRNTDNVYQKQKRKTCTVYAWNSTKMDETRDTELHVHTEETVSSLTNKFVLIPTTTGCGECAIPPRWPCDRHSETNSAGDSIVEAEAPTKMQL